MDRININLPPDLHASIKALAARRNEPNTAALIRLALNEFVQEHATATQPTHAPRLCGVLRPEHVEAVRADLVPRLMTVCGAKLRTPEQFIQDIELDVSWIAKLMDASVTYTATETEHFGDNVPSVLVYSQLDRSNNHTNKPMIANVLQPWCKPEFWRFFRGTTTQYAPYNMEAVVRCTTPLPKPAKYTEVDAAALDDAVTEAWVSEQNSAIEECIFEFLQRHRHVDVLEVVPSLFNEKAQLLRVPLADGKNKGVQHTYLEPHCRYVPPMNDDAHAVWQDFTAFWPFAPDLVDFTVDALVADTTTNNYVFVEVPSNGAKTFFAECAAGNTLGASRLRGPDDMDLYNTLEYRIKNYHQMLVQFIDDAECSFGSDPYMMNMTRTCVDSYGLPVTLNTKARVFMGMDFNRTLEDTQKCSAPAGGSTPATTRYAMLRIHDEGSDIKHRTLFKTMGGTVYKRALGDAIAHRTSMRLNQYIALGEAAAGPAGSGNVADFQRKYGASI